MWYGSHLEATFPQNGSSRGTRQCVCKTGTVRPCANGVRRYMYITNHEEALLSQATDELVVPALRSMGIVFPYTSTPCTPKYMGRIWYHNDYSTLLGTSTMPCNYRTRTLRRRMVLGVF